MIKTNVTIGGTAHPTVFVTNEDLHEKGFKQEYVDINTFRIYGLDSADIYSADFVIFVERERARLFDLKARDHELFMENLQLFWNVFIQYRLNLPIEKKIDEKEVIVITNRKFKWIAEETLA
jgi:hypothetical protein